MSSQFFNNFCLYQNAMLRIGLGKDELDNQTSPKDVTRDIDDLISAASNAEHNLSDVISVSDSYNEILKMIM